MAYTPSTFVSGSTTVPVSAYELNKLGAGIAQAQAVAEQAQAVATTASAVAGSITAGIAGIHTAVRISNSSAVTATTLTADGSLTASIAAIAGRRIAVSLYLMFTADPTSTPINLGISATNTAGDVSGTLYLTSRTLDGTGNQGACAALAAGKASVPIPVLSANTHFVHGFATLVAGSGTSNISIAVLSSQTATGSGVVLLAGSCIRTEILI